MENRSECVFAVNGLFLSQQITGIQRFSREILKALDVLLSPQDPQVEIIVPLADNVFEYAKDLHRIIIVPYGKHKGFLWEQWDFYRYCRKNNRKMVCLCNVVPLLGKVEIATIHDLSYKVNPQFFKDKRGLASAFWHKVQYRKIMRSAKKIVTVSQLSKQEIEEVYHVPCERIHVVYNACNHLQDIVITKDIEEKYKDIPDKGYYFAMSTIAPNKNFKWILDNASLFPENLYFMSGKGGRKEFEAYNKLQNVHYLGYVSDAEMKYLMQHCKAFLFPSLYEGFGVPPLEALYCGSLAIVSDIPIMHEIYGEAATYINPDDASVDLGLLSYPSQECRNECLSRYSWEKSAEILSKLFNRGSGE